MSHKPVFFFLVPLMFGLMLGLSQVSVASECGNGITEPPEQCDDGNTVDGDGCSQDCIIECGTHCDCNQGDYCYKGVCRTDPDMKVYCCDKKDSCPPGHWCVQQDERKSVCEESESYVCESACDCGPAHACLEIEGYGQRCVKDHNDPWLPGPGKGTVPWDESVIQGEDATYCCDQPNCHAGRLAYGDYADLFLCWTKQFEVALNFCSSQSCGSTCDCRLGESCVDTLTQPTPPPGTSCGEQWRPDGLAPPTCISNAMAESFYGYKPSDLLPCCRAGCPLGTKCELGWKQGGGYLLERVIGTCGGICGNDTCDIGENAINCPEDCYAPDWEPVCEDSNLYTGYFSICGDGICDPNGYTPENCMTCPSDCGAPVHSDDDYVADCIDICPETIIPELNVPSSGRLGKNRWAMLQGNGFFQQAEPQDREQYFFTAWDTYGCSCEQIIEALDLGAGQIKFGCSTSVMLDWISQ